MYMYVYISRFVLLFVYVNSVRVYVCLSLYTYMKNQTALSVCVLYYHEVRYIHLPTHERFEQNT